MNSTIHSASVHLKVEKLQVVSCGVYRKTPTKMSIQVAKIFLFDDEVRPPKRRNNALNLTTTNKIRKSLFGACDPAETEILLQEQFEIDRTRILNKFGFDIKDIENLEKGQLNKENKESPLKEKRKIISKNRPVFKPYNRENQPMITGKQKHTFYM